MSQPVAGEYVPTIINERSLLPRLASEIYALQRECRLAWPYFKQHPLELTAALAVAFIKYSRRKLLTGHVLAAVFTVMCVVAAVGVFERHIPPSVQAADSDETQLAEKATFINLDKKAEDKSIGRGGKARVGFQNSKGEGSGEVRRRSSGGGGGGNNDPLPQQVGKLPPPSDIVAAIPKVPPTHPPTLPAAGIVIDPALWKDLKAPVYGDPRSNSNASSNGPGTGGGFGTNVGTGIGEGKGPGVGPGNNGNMGGGDNQRGCCGTPGGNGDNASIDQRIFRGPEVEQRARLLFKPEPQYTEEARRNQITGTVTLRVVFSSSGQVEQIRAMHTLPFGLTEKAIAAARQIKFVPATKGGRAVSVWMQLEYNFNLY